MSGSRAIGGARMVAVGVVLGALVSWIPGDFRGALAVLAALTGPVVLWLLLRSRKRDASFVLSVFVAAVGVRVVVAIVIEVAAPTGYFALDERIYENGGRELAELWANGAAPALSDYAGYTVWNALLYACVGFAPLAPTLVNALLAGVSVLLVHRMARACGGPRAARTAALLVAFFPSLVLWSSLNLKDAFAITTILVALRGAQILCRGFHPGGVLLLALGMIGLAQFRSYLVLLLAASAAVAWTLPRLSRRGAPLPLILGTWALVCIVATVALLGIEGLADQSPLETLDRHRRNLALGASAYHADADVSTPAAAARFLPIGVAYFLLAPAPWQIWNSRQWLTLPEMLLWYALLPQVVLGLRFALRERLPAALPLATFALLATISYALVESNLGTAYRHRAQVLTLYLIFAAVGLARGRAERADAVAAPATRLGEVAA